MGPTVPSGLQGSLPAERPYPALALVGGDLPVARALLCRAGRDLLDLDDERPEPSLRHGRQHDRLAGGRRGATRAGVARPDATRGPGPRVAHAQLPWPRDERLHLLDVQGRQVLRPRPAGAVRDLAVVPAR